jgi:hypothetical protein
MKESCVVLKENKPTARCIGEQQNSSAVNEHFKLQIKTLQNAPREVDKLKRLLKIKEREKEEAILQRFRQVG